MGTTKTGPDRAVRELKGLPVTLLVDYDGTLVPIAPTPSLAVPDEDLMCLLTTAAAAPQVDFHIVSGRPVANLHAWFGHLSVALWAEHGFWRRRMAGDAWQAEATIPTQSLEQVRPIFEQFTAATPGALLEEKSAGFAWHYRNAESALAARQAHLLRTHLADALRNTPLEIVDGKKIVEVRMRGINKALVAERVLARKRPEAAVLAIGDDETDEDLFRALPDSAVTVAVGPADSSARYRLDDHYAVRSLLQGLLA